MPKFHKDMVPNPKYRGEGVNGQTFPICHKCGRYRLSDCLASSSVCFGCGVMDHKLRNCPWVPNNDKDNRQQSQRYPL